MFVNAESDPDRCFIDRLSGFGYNWMRGFSADGLPTRKEKGAFCRETAVRAYEKENVITSDSIILDRCKSWVNLLAGCVERQGVQPIRVWA